MKTYKAIIVPTVAGGNIEVKVSANSVSQAIGIIKTVRDNDADALTAAGRSCQHHELVAAVS